MRATTRGSSTGPAASSFAAGDDGRERGGVRLGPSGREDRASDAGACREARVGQVSASVFPRAEPAAGASCSLLRGPASETAIVVKPIPFGAARRSETAAYARRHYGQSTWRLVHPRVIVEHYTASNSFSSTYSAFSSDVPRLRVHELPGTCAHFVIDTDGTIYSSSRPRSSVATRSGSTTRRSGSNTSVRAMPRSWPIDGSGGLARADRVVDGPVRDQARQRVGHNESLTSRYHHERVRRLALPDAWRLDKGDMKLDTAEARGARQPPRRFPGPPVSAGRPHC